MRARALDAPVTWYVGGTQLGWQSSAREIGYGVTPKVLEFDAREITASRRLDRPDDHGDRRRAVRGIRSFVDIATAWPAPARGRPAGMR